MSTRDSDRRSPSTVDPQLLFGISLVVGLVLAWPSLSAAMHGEVDIVVAGARLLAAIALSWAGGYGLIILFTSFARSNEDRDAALKVANEHDVPNVAALPSDSADAA